MRRTISAIIFGLGLFMSLLGFFVWFGMSFCAGAYQSPQELNSWTIYFLVFFFASVLVFWKRLPAGASMLFLPSILVYGAIAQRGYLIQKGISQQESLQAHLQSEAFCIVPVWILGAFAFLTGLYGWPEVIIWRPERNDLRLSPHQ